MIWISDSQSSVLIRIPWEAVENYRPHVLAPNKLKQEVGPEHCSFKKSSLDDANS